MGEKGDEEDKKRERRKWVVGRMYLRLVDAVAGARGRGGGEGAVDGEAGGAWGGGGREVAD